jgi:uncharacterized membrane protein
MFRIAISILCSVGFYASLFMLRKSRMAERGNVDGPSVVKEPHARLFFGAPNSLFGSLYFPLLAAAVWIYPWLAAPVLRWLIVLAVAAAAATSLFLAYSLLFITKRRCPYCWTAHIVNWLLLFLVPLGTS